MTSPTVSGLPELSVGSPGLSAGLAGFRRLSWRASVLQHSDLPQVWCHVDEWGLDPTVPARDCGCAGDTRRPCLAPEVCLAVALLVDDPAPWRAEYSCADREALWGQLVAHAVAVDPWIGTTPPGEVA